MEIRDLYRDVILDHNRKPRNFGVLAPPARQATGHNPLCGDRLEVYVRLEGERIAEVSFEGKGCAISVASASLMTEAVKGRTTAEADAIYRNIHHVLTAHDAPVEASLGKLAALAGVRDFPARVKCASLCWHTLHAALAASEPQSVTTE